MSISEEEEQNRVVNIYQSIINKRNNALIRAL